MLVSLNWLKNYVDITHLSTNELAEKITKSGIEVDGIEYIAKPSKNVVVGFVTECGPHPNADKLNLCQVDIGDGELLQIICGAPNVKQGQKVAVAKPGAVLPGNVKIKRVKLRGIESNGMICSLQELGIQEKYVPKDVADGIFVFPEDTAIGQDVTSLLNLDDAVLDFDLTPNRADCLNMMGVAYEAAAILNQPLQLPEETVSPIDEAATSSIAVQVDAPDLAPYYGAFIVKDIEIKPAPLWMRNYLMAAGIRPINNVVDITNYVLLEYGQPLHAFDYDRLGTKEIVVRRAMENESMVTLDGQERVLSPQNLVITNGKEPVALAGVMGGANTEVAETTRTVLLEAAYFDPATVRTTVKKTGLRSESSTRFEKGVDPNRVNRAGVRACQLLEQYANGKVLKQPVIVDALDYTEKEIDMDTEEINKRLGTTITAEEVAGILETLRFGYEQTKDHFHVHVPTRRGDITIFEDMLEEVARIYGYDNLPYTLPQGAAQAGGLTQRQYLKRQVKKLLQGMGMMETITYSLTRDAYIQKLISPEIALDNPVPVQLSMPMSEDHKYLRLSLLPELLHVATYNMARNQADIAYYELGSIFVTDEKQVTKQPDERLRLAGVLSGLWLDHEWQQEKKAVDFYVAKGIVEGLFNYLQLPVTFEQETIPDMHPGRCATIVHHEQVIGFLGQVHPQLAKQLDLQETYVFDINLEQVLTAHKNVPGYQPIPKYPSTIRDIAFVLDDEVKAGNVKTLIEQTGKDLVKDSQIFDVYTGEHLPDGKKSIAYRLLYQHPERTLTDEEVEASYQTIISAVNDTYDAYVRS
ncbi:phenylalanine--tRNA ligase subunit beta [Lentibacillus sp. N15]|uniref:phenylalanine--tRNA ligase subunit beta n=1 Tax=Lentibacillus songyuanensis TaxID=3136161 RepID=UPI0031BA7DCA